MFWYRFLDLFFIVFHSVIIVFNLFGWLWKPARKINLITLLLTGFSWFILGVFYGIGYCPLTDWHWKVLHHLGKTDLPDSYVSYLLKRITGHGFNNGLIETLTVVLFFMALAASGYINLKRRDKANNQN
jgi:hypothetical protein